MRFSSGETLSGDRPTPEEPSDHINVRAAERAVEVLFSVAESEQPLTLSEIAKGTGLDASTAFRMVNTLMRVGALARLSSNGRYRVGPRFLQILLSNTKYDALRAVAMPAMNELHAVTGETVGLFVLEWPDRHCVAFVESSWGLRRTHRPGERFAITAGATGIAMLSCMQPERVQEALLLYPPPAFTQQTVVDKPSIARLVEEAREQRFSVSFSQIHEGMSTIASPVTGPEGQLIAAINIAGPSFRWTLDKIMAVAPKLVEATAQVSRQLSYPVEQ